MECSAGEVIRKVFETRSGRLFVMNRRIALEGDMNASIGFGELLPYGAAGRRTLRLIWGKGRNVVKIRMANESAEMAVGFIMSALDGEPVP